MHNKPSITAVIPFYNENYRIINVLNTLTKIKEISRIICIDDGSTDDTTSLIEKTFPSVQIVGYTKNKGKSQAIKYALKYIESSHILLFDADLKEFGSSQIVRTLKATLAKPAIDSVIFKQVNDPLICKFLRLNLLVSGERILKTKGLKEIYRSDFSNYQLELTINNYLSKNNKNVYWVPFSSQNHLKLEKWSPQIALLKSLQFQKLLFTPSFIFQLLFFKPKKL